MARSGKAAVCRELNKPVVVETISVDSPKRGEVMVKLAACGVCHSDLSATNGTIPLPPPLVLGHEGAGEIVEVGEGVASFAVGDHVVTSFIYMCGKCRFCSGGRPVLCVEQGKALLTPPEGTPREFRAQVELVRAGILAQIEDLAALGLKELGGLDDLDSGLLGHAMLALAEMSGRLVLTDPEKFTPDRLVAFVSRIAHGLR